MKYKIAFLDRDGTINVDKSYLYKIEDFKFLPGVIEGMKKLQDNGYLLVIITNQSGIGRGYYTVEDMERLHNWLRGKLHVYSIRIAGIYYCPHLPNAKIDKYRCKCNCRKPKTGMFWQAIYDLGNKYSLDLKHSVAIGDKERDLTICKEIGAKGVIVGNNASSGWMHASHDFYEAVKWILEVDK